MTRRRVRADELLRDDLMVSSGRRVTQDPIVQAHGLVKITVYNPLSDATRTIELWRDDNVVVERP